MKRKLLGTLCIVVALVVSGFLWSLIQGYENTTFYNLDQGKGHYSQNELFFTPIDNEGDGKYALAAGGISYSPKKSFSTTIDSQEVKVDYYLYNNAVFPIGEGYELFYAANTDNRFILLFQGKKYLADISIKNAVPLFSNSSLYDNFAEDIQGISSNGSYCAKISEGTATVIKLKTDSLSPEDVKEYPLSGITSPRFVRFINGIHLWFEGEKDGVKLNFILDCSSGKINQCEKIPDGFSGELKSRIWLFSNSEKDGNTELSAFNVISGATQKISLDPALYPNAELQSITTSGQYAIFSYTNGSAIKWAVVKFETNSVTVIDEEIADAQFASDQVFLINKKDNTHTFVKIIH